MATETPESRVASFGPNEWLVDEIYEQFLADRNSVDPAWWEFFEGYTPPDYSPHAATPAPATPPVVTPIAPAAPTYTTTLPSLLRRTGEPPCAVPTVVVVPVPASHT